MMYSKEDYYIAEILKQINKVFICFHCERTINEMYLNLIYLDILDIDDYAKICNNCLSLLKQYNVNNDKCSLHDLNHEEDKFICQRCKDCISCNPY